MDLRQQLAAKTASNDRWQQECKAAQQQLARELDQRQHFQGEAAALKQQLASVSLHASAACYSISRPPGGLPHHRHATLLDIEEQAAASLSQPAWQRGLSLNVKQRGMSVMRQSFRGRPLCSNNTWHQSACVLAQPVCSDGECPSRTGSTMQSGISCSPA